MNLIRTLIIGQHVSCQKKDFTTFTTGLMTELGIHLDVLLAEPFIPVCH